jgi:Uma2 family endonuclease
MITLVDQLIKTWDDFRKLPESDDGRRYELLDGRLYVTPAPNNYHQIVIGNLYVLLRPFVERHRLGIVFLSPLDVKLSQRTVCEPDLLFISRRNRMRVVEWGVDGAPDLAVEVLSRSTRRRDLGKKRELYGHLGVTEYWVLDPSRRGVSITRYTNVKGRMVERDRVEKGGVLRSPLFPGLRLKVDEVFRDPFRD